MPKGVEHTDQQDLTTTKYITDVSTPLDWCTARQALREADARGHVEYGDGNRSTEYHSTVLFGNDGKPIG